MNNIIIDAKEEIFKLEGMLKRIDVFLDNAPEGCLKWQRRRGKTYYYQQYVNKMENLYVENEQEKESAVVEIRRLESKEETERYSRKYITNENISLVKDLAKKHYYKALKNVMQKQLKALKKFVQNYPTTEIEAIYDDMRDERKVFIESIELTVKEKVQQWKDEEYEKNTSFPEHLKFQTEQGDIVRSKSEVIIANILYQHQKDILYKYERPLEVMENGRVKTIYPDFTILNVHTGKVTYWEHAGRMDDPGYANDFVRKMNRYIANGLEPGKDVLLTFETKEYPLDIKVVKRLVQTII